MTDILTPNHLRSFVTMYPWLAPYADAWETDKRNYALSEDDFVAEVGRLRATLRRIIAAGNDQEAIARAALAEKPSHGGPPMTLREVMDAEDGGGKS